MYIDWIVSASTVYELPTNISNPKIVVDKDGNLYIVFTSTLTINTEGSYNRGGKDIIVLRVLFNGELSWITQGSEGNEFNSSGDEDGVTLDIDVNGDLIMAYTTTGNIGSNTRTGDTDIVLAKISKTDGHVIFIVQNSTINTTGQNIAPSIKCDNLENIYLAYSTNGNILEFTNTGGYDIVVHKIDKNGNVVHTNQTQNTLNFNTTGSEFNPKIICDSKNNIYITYTTTGKLSNNSKTANIDIVLSKFNSDCVCVWTKQNSLINSNFDNTKPTIALDNDENIILAYVSNDVKTKIIICKIDPDGNVLWRLLNNDYQSIENNTDPIIKVDNNGIILAYVTEGALYNDTRIGSTDVAYVSLDFDGNFIRHTQGDWINYSGINNSVDMSIDKYNKIYSVKLDTLEDISNLMVLRINQPDKFVISGIQHDEYKKSFTYYFDKEYKYEPYVTINIINTYTENKTFLWNTQINNISTSNIDFTITSKNSYDAPIPPVTLPMFYKLYGNTIGMTYILYGITPVFNVLDNQYTDGDKWYNAKRFFIQNNRQVVYNNGSIIIYENDDESLTLYDVKMGKSYDLHNTNSISKYTIDILITKGRKIIVYNGKINSKNQICFFFIKDNPSETTFGYIAHNKNVSDDKPIVVYQENINMFSIFFRVSNGDILVATASADINHVIEYYEWVLAPFRLYNIESFNVMCDEIYYYIACCVYANNKYYIKFIKLSYNEGNFTKLSTSILNNYQISHITIFKEKIDNIITFTYYNINNQACDYARIDVGGEYIFVENGTVDSNAPSQYCDIIVSGDVTRIIYIKNNEVYVKRMSLNIFSPVHILYKFSESIVPIYDIEINVIGFRLVG